MKDASPLVLVSWDGLSVPLQFILHDGDAQFEILIFDYSGTHSALNTIDIEKFGRIRVISHKTECKGDIYSYLAAHLRQRTDLPSVVGLIDDDVLLTVNDINRLLHIGKCNCLYAFSPALSHDSHYSHEWMLKKAGDRVRFTDWVEVMSPFYETSMFLAASMHFEGYISSWGFDCYLFPAIQKIKNMERTAVVDAVVATHLRPVRSIGRRFRNGLTAETEMENLRQSMMNLMKKENPNSIETEWFKRIYVQNFQVTNFQKLRKKMRSWVRGYLVD